MNCWMLTKIFLVFLFWEPHDPGLQQLSKNGFVDISSMHEWHLSPGENETVMIKFRIKNGYHIQSNHVLDDNLIPTSLTTQSPDEIIVQDPIFPPSYSFQLKNANQEMLVFHNELDVKIPVVASENIKAGNYTITANLHYQACDDVKCYFPRDLPFEIQITVR